MSLVVLCLVAAVFAAGWVSYRPDAPRVLTARVDDAHNDLDWGDVPESTGYLVLRSIAGRGTFWPVGLTHRPRFVDRIGGREMGEYEYAVVAIRGVWPGERSRSITASDVAIAVSVTADEDRTIVASTGEVSLFIPAGAFDQDTTVTITERPSSVAGPERGTEFMTGAYDFGPEGSLFESARPRLTLAYEVPGAREDFERDWVSATARIFYRSPDDGSWSDASRGLMADAGNDTVSGELVHFSTYASGYTVMPHGRYDILGSDCASCHDVHEAADASITARTGLDLCYYCHGGAMATDAAAGAHGPNVQTEFLSSEDQAVTAGDSVHPVLDGRMNCSDCHNPHLDPGANPKLLFAWEADGTQTAVADSEGTLGNAFCFGCHGDFDNTRVNDSYYAASGGNHETTYAGPHATLAFAPAATNDTTCSITPVNGSGVQCLVCHQRHGTAGADYLNAYALGTGADRQALCYQCHESSTGADATWNDRHIPDEFARASVHDITGATGAQLTCANCHNSHSVQAGGAKSWQVGRFSDPDDITASVTNTTTFCLRCHDGGPPQATMTTSVIVPYDVGFPDWSENPFFSGFDKASIVSSAHFTTPDISNMTVGCDSCHDPHGSDNPRLTAFTGGYDVSPISMHSGQPIRGNTSAWGEERLCYGCHAVSTGCACHGIPALYDLNVSSQMRKIATNTGLGWDPWRSVSSTTGRYVDDVIARDMDGDMDVDVVARFREGSYAVSYVRVYTSNGANPPIWTEQTVETNATGQIHGMAVGDIDGDGDPDIVTGGSDGRVRLHRNGGGSPIAWASTVIATADPSPAGRTITSVAIGDVDADGDSDVVWCFNYSGVGSIRLTSNTNGTGTSWSTTSIADTTDQSYVDLVVGRLSGQGGRDIAITSARTGTTTDYVLSQYANDGTWTGSTVATSAYPYAALVAADDDGDGDDDLITANRWTVYHYANSDGDGTAWDEAVVSNSGYTLAYSVGVADVDGDATLDILVGRQVYNSSSNYHEAAVYRNPSGNANTWLEWSVDATATESIYGIAGADVNGDGFCDVITGGTSDYVRWYENRSGGFAVSAHPTNAVMGAHDSLEGPAGLGAGNRHAECVDCHDVHRAGSGTHTLGTNLASASISGSRGVNPGDRTPFGPPASFTVVPVEFEYQLCYKCHSSYTTGYTGEDKAKEFNPDNAATHPVEGTGANLGVKDGSFTEGTPWNPTSADEYDYRAVSPPMTCTDCHGSETAADPNGPHGSTIPHVLKGAASEDWTGDGKDSALCLACHRQDVYMYFGDPVGGSANIQGLESSDSRINHRHFYNRGATCLECHFVHGSNMQHLIKGSYTHTSTGGTVRNFSGCSSIGTCHGSGSQKTYSSGY